MEIPHHEEVFVAYVVQLKPILLLESFLKLRRCLLNVLVDGLKKSVGLVKMSVLIKLNQILVRVLDLELALLLIVYFVLKVLLDFYLLLP